MYYVFVCPKCQSHAQLWQPGSKTVACQKCRAKIQTNTLRVYGPFEKHDDAVEKRSLIQAELSQKPGTFSSQESSIFSVPLDKEIQLNPPKAKKPHQIILDVLKENGTMIVADCEYYCAERGVDSETFQKMLKKLIEAGDIYRPDKGLIALVP
ncbi:hypothetical protein LJC08_03980 [Methanimicrococcus sp. OttesenSCG-928-J09]|nr:hypothetical protein [Methanimicrococcus sp. OttesenSCG-928-J09]